MFIVVLSGIISLGLGVFYQQQLTNAAREAARYAAIHSATSQCPTTSWKQPNLSRLPDDFDLNNYFDCDPPDLRWPEMSAHARQKVFALNPSEVTFAACWSGYWDQAPNGYDAGPIDADGNANTSGTAPSPGSTHAQASTRWHVPHPQRPLLTTWPATWPQPMPPAPTR